MRLGNVSANATTQAVPWYQSVLQTVTQAATAYLTLDQQKELLRIQNERARQGLPPLDVSQYTPGVSVGVEASTRNTALLVVGLLVGGMILAKAIK
jgi:hypothetical protein